MKKVPAVTFIFFVFWGLAIFCSDPEDGGGKDGDSQANQSDQEGSRDSEDNCLLGCCSSLRGCWRKIVTSCRRTRRCCDRCGSCLRTLCANNCCCCCKK